jgi:uncharacterized membrane protein YbhN (UPF0104 family)
VRSQRDTNLAGSPRPTAAKARTLVSSAGYQPFDSMMALGLGRTAFFVLLALGLACGALLADSWIAGFDKIADVLLRPDWNWLPAAVGGEVAAYLGYTLAYREIVRVERGPHLELRHAAALVTSGFGVFMPRGGFAADVAALGEHCEDERDARIRVLGLGALEFAVLGPAACACALYLIFRGWKVQPGLTLPWAIAVPVGFVAAVFALRHRSRFAGGRGWRAPLDHALHAIHVLKRLLELPRDHGVPAFLGMTLYWTGDIFVLWACLRVFLGHPPSLPAVVLGYATGYALTRRSLPVGGAGAVEALLPFALLWVAVPLAPAVLAVVFYRAINLWLPLLPALTSFRAVRQRAAA